MKKRILHFVKGAVLVAGALGPAALGTPAGRSFLEHHSGVASLMAASGGLLVVVYKWAKNSPS